MPNVALTVALTLRTDYNNSWVYINSVFFTYHWLHVIILSKYDSIGGKK
ncbi:MAG: hypothetical protein BWX72_01850 [Firmicutes bacterium ADurb.Bin080]|nr:MAG: hypothetical protein BWX72_01850 [Firmicutes bacterium ADurb.Bin080]